MGGMNSGLSTGRRTTVDMRQLDLRALKRAGLLEAGSTFGWSWWRPSGQQLHHAAITVHADHVSIVHDCQRAGGELAEGRYTIGIERTACHLGGQRAWWRCPAQGCGRRVAMLYGGNGAVFACRHCYRLNYRCQRETDSDRLIRRLEKLRGRLGWQPGIFHGTGAKPHRMRWQTYWRLWGEHERMAQAVIGGIAQLYGLGPRRG